VTAAVPGGEPRCHLLHERVGDAFGRGDRGRHAVGVVHDLRVALGFVDPLEELDGGLGVLARRADREARAGLVRAPVLGAGLPRRRLGDLVDVDERLGRGRTEPLRLPRAGVVHRGLGVGERRARLLAGDAVDAGREAFLVDELLDLRERLDDRGIGPFRPVALGVEVQDQLRLVARLRDQRQHEVEAGRPGVVGQRARDQAGLGTDRLGDLDQVVPGLRYVDAGLLQDRGVVVEAERLGHPAERVLLAVVGVLVVRGREEALEEVLAERLLEVERDAGLAVLDREHVRRVDVGRLAAGDAGLQRGQVGVGVAEDAVLDRDVRMARLELLDERGPLFALLAVPGPHADLRLAAAAP
jgi:hypothetical protein